MNTYFETKFGPQYRKYFSINGRSKVATEKDFSLKTFDQDPTLELSASAKFSWDSEHLIVEYQLIGDLKHVQIPEQRAPEGEGRRVIGLWNHTCFELFIKRRGGPDYLEFNFSPNGDWNCFYFEDYRSDIQEWRKFIAPKGIITREKRTFSARFWIPLAQLPALFQANHELGLSPAAVVLYKYHPHYFANKHPDEVANFHHPESFTFLTR